MQKCKFKGRITPANLGPKVDGRPCYQFEAQLGGPRVRVYVIPIAAFWGFDPQ